MKTTFVPDIELAYERQGKGVPLILIHGYPLDHSIWDKVVPLLKDSFDLVIPDLRGFGKSQVLEKEYGMDDYAADIAGLMDELKIPQAMLVGHSMGGYVALAFARKYPGRVMGLGLVSSQAAADPPDRKEGRYKTAEDVELKGVGIVADAMAPKLSADTGLQKYAHDLIAAQDPAGVEWALRAMAERQDGMDLMKTFQLPLVLVHGEADALIPIDKAREIESAVLQSRMFALAGLGHLPMLEDPQKTADALKHLI